MSVLFTKCHTFKFIGRENRNGTRFIAGCTVKTRLNDVGELIELSFFRNPGLILVGGEGSRLELGNFVGDYRMQ